MAATCPLSQLAQHSRALQSHGPSSNRKSVCASAIGLHGDHRPLPPPLRAASQLSLAAALGAAMLLAPATTLPSLAAQETLSTSSVEQGEAASPSSSSQTAVVSVPPPLAFNDSRPIQDEARMIPRGQLDGLQQELRELEAQTGWRVRLLSGVGRPGDDVIDAIRAGWHFDSRTVVIFADPTSPNLFNIKWGTDVNAILPQRFFSELKSRFGNLYYVRDNGEGKAVTGLLGALTGCLRQGGCSVVPGLVDEEYTLTLWCTVAGGLLFGATSRIEPQGWVQRQWVWPLLFSPLWGSLFISFGLGPILVRTDDLQPILQNCLAFAGAAALVAFAPGLAGWTGMRPWSDSDTSGGSNNGS